MKKTLFALCVACAMIDLSAFGQTAAQVYTTRHEIADFMEKTTKFVLTGNIFYDKVLRDAVDTRWEISPYEFCTYGEYQTLKGKPEYYFVVTNISKYPGEEGSGIRVLDAFKTGTDHNINIVTVPVGNAEELSEQNVYFFPILVEFMQEFIRKATERDSYAYGNLATLASFNKIPRTAEIITDSSKIIEAMESADPDKVVVYDICPSNPTYGVSHSYKMYIGCSDHTLYMYKDKKIPKKK